MNLRVFFYIYLFIYFVVVCVCVCVAFFALTLWYILLSFPFYSIRWFIHVIVHALINLCKLVLEGDSIDKPLTFKICLLQLIFHTCVFT